MQVLEIVDARKTCSIMKEVRVMEYLLAKSDRQLGICLRMLYDEGYKGLVVESVINAKTEWSSTSRLWLTKTRWRS